MEVQRQERAVGVAQRRRDRARVQREEHFGVVHVDGRVAEPQAVEDDVEGNEHAQRQPATGLRHPYASSSGTANTSKCRHLDNSAA